jgi:hypothetical protein
MGLDGPVALGSDRGGCTDLRIIVEFGNDNLWVLLLRLRGRGVPSGTMAAIGIAPRRPVFKLHNILLRQLAIDQRPS